jgi:hypothetical protein
MPSTPSAYPQVISGRLTSFRVLEIEVFPARGNFCAWFDSRQLHKRELVRAKSLGQLSFINIPSTSAAWRDAAQDNRQYQTASVFVDPRSAQSYAS